eukprot:s3425_g10.t1
MFRLIRTGEYDPDMSAIDRVVQLADGGETGQQVGQPASEGVDDGSDSDSSVASLESVHEEDSECVELDDRCISLFPSFPGVPESGLMVHGISALVHVVNEDDVLLCGRPTSRHFKDYAKVTDRDHLAACRQCLRAFQNGRSVN